MAPDAVGSSKAEREKVHYEILEKLKVDEEKEKKKLEKESRRRAELEKIKSESFMRQADLLVPLKKKKQPNQQKKYVLNPQPKTSKQKKQNHNLENKSNQGFSFEPKTSVWNKKQPTNSQGRTRYDSSSSESSSKRYGENCWGNSKISSVPDSIWNNRNEHFPILGAEAPVPAVNVWEERKYKQEEIQALQPHNKYDEEAMLQQALALSLMEATREEEQKQKFAEEYKLQTEVLEHNPKILDNFKELDEPAVSKKSELESVSVLESTEEQFNNQKFSRNAALSSTIEKSKTSSSGGAKPKINKIIDSFGGWGLKGSKIENSNTVSNFTNDIDDKAWQNGNHLPGIQTDVVNNTKKSKTVSNWKTSDTGVQKHVSDPWSNDFSKEVEKHVSDPWSNDFRNDIKTSSTLDPWENKVLSHEKVSFEGNSINLSHLNSVADPFDVSSSEKEYLKEKSADNVSSIWHNSEDEPAKDSDQWEDASSTEKPTDITNRNSVRYPDNLATNDTETNSDNAWESVTNLEDTKLLKEEPSKNSSDKHDIFDVFTKSSLAVGTPIGSYSIKKEKELPNGNNFSQFENTYNHVSCDTDKLKDVSVPSETSLSKDDLWSNKSPNMASASNSAFPNQNILSTDLHGQESPYKFGTTEENSLLPELTLNKDNDTPILPPHPVCAVPNEFNQETKELNNTDNTEIFGDKYTEESPTIFPPRASPQMPSPYLFNPAMFPGVPMLGVGMDPITVRQMLMLSNPFFASQLLSMEQYYRTLGIPVDLFSFPTPTVPNMLFPSVANTLEQNNLNPVNVNVPFPHDSLQSQYQDQCVLSKNIDSVISDKCPPGLDKNSTANISDTEENLWYASLLSSDSESVIPPPKPLHATDKVPSTSQSYETAESANFSHNLNSKGYMSTNLPSNSHRSESHKPLATGETSLPKPKISGWGDIDDDFHKGKSKTNSWDDDYGWGTESSPTKSVKNPAKYEDKKVIPRQPARQPQLSRFQKNRRFN